MDNTTNDRPAASCPSCTCGGRARRAGNLPTAILWVSAFMLAALTIVQAGRLPLNAAFAAAANQGNQGMSVVTQNTGLGPPERPYEALWVLDSRGEMLFIYYIENANSGEKSLLLRQAMPVVDLFRVARGG